MAYVDIFLAAVPADRAEAYRDFVVRTGPVFQEHGALDILELWGDDVPDGKITSLPMAVKLQAGEVVTTGFVRWPSKSVRDQGVRKVMDDPRMAPGPDGPVFDMSRMIFGGFEILHEL